MLDWLRGKKKDNVTRVLELLKKETAKELKESAQLDNLYDGLEALRCLIGDEISEKKLDSQLVHQFNKEKPMLQQKNRELTAALETEIAMIQRFVGTAEEEIIKIDDAIKAGNKTETARNKRSLRQTFIGLQNTIEEAKELAEALQRFQELAHVACTQLFINRLKEPFFKPQSAQIQELLIKITNSDWLMKNSEKLRTGNLFALPRGHKNLRIIYIVMKGLIVVLDIMDHRTYEKAFAKSTRPPDYSGPFINVSLPLAQFAKAH